MGDAFRGERFGLHEVGKWFSCAKMLSMSSNAFRVDINLRGEMTQMSLFLTQ